MTSSKKIKVLHIIKSLGRGGAEMLLPETLKLHNTENFEFHYIYFLPWKNQLAGELARHNGIVTCMDAGNTLTILARIPRIIEYVRNNDISLVHAHLPWAGIVARVVRRLTGIPVVYTEHNKQERYHWATRAANLLTMNWLSALVAVSDDVKESLVKHKPSLKIPLHTLLNGVNYRHFKRGSVPSSIRQELGIPPTCTVIGTIAVFRFQKRLDLWLDIAEEICKKNNSLRFIIVGDGPLNAELRSKASGTNIADKVYFVGLQTEIRPYLEAMDIYLMTSIYEGLPIALLEAMAFGLPVVTTDAGGIKQVITHGKDGLMCGVDEIDKLKEMTGHLALNETLRAELGSNARARVQQSFSIDTMVDDLEKLYLSIVVGREVKTTINI